MNIERKIETALEWYFHSEEWTIDKSDSDHFATMFITDDMGGVDEVTINLTECAKAIADEMATHAA